MFQTDWIYGLIGGAMIGTAASVYLLVNGRILGASGIIGDLIDRSGRTGAAERLAFLAGLVLIPGALALIWPTQTHLTGSMPVVIAAGLLVGVGSRLANGCTSGHGVCGMSRLSVRSIVATVVYLLAGAVGVLVFRHWTGVI